MTNILTDNWATSPFTMILIQGQKCSVSLFYYQGTRHAFYFINFYDSVVMIEL